MSNYNPDYPVSTGAFTMHTYNNQFGGNAPESVYYNGINPFQQGSADSRRNIGMPQQQQQQQFGTYQQSGMNVNAQQQYNEANLQPFSSYPPQRPVNAVNTGLNASLSRRNDGYVPGCAQLVAPAMPVNVPVQQQMMQQQVNPFMATYANYGTCVEPGMQALYSQQPMTQFDRKGCWDNPYTQCRQIDAPVVNWNQYGQQSAMMSLNPSAYTQQPMPQYNQEPQYPVSNPYPHADKTWLEIAKANWGV